MFPDAAPRNAAEDDRPDAADVEVMIDGDRSHDAGCRCDGRAGMRASEQAVAEHDRIGIHELVTLKHRPAEERREVPGGEVVLEDDGALFHAGLIQHQDPLPERRGDLTDHDKGRIRHRCGVEERSQPLGIPGRFDEGDGIVALLQVIEGDIGCRAFLPEVFGVAERSQHGDIQVAHMPDHLVTREYEVNAGTIFWKKRARARGTRDPEGPRTAPFRASALFSRETAMRCTIPGDPADAAGCAVGSTHTTALTKYILTN